MAARGPCCEKMGMKKGAWTPEEDQILISHIQRYGHANWRALPKQAGLHRCGKSCRLRWINYLRPDIKRGNFTTEEEETIFKLHQVLGNRWSAIAARLPGRTDNEIKNYWNGHLKKKLKQDSIRLTDRKEIMKEARIAVLQQHQRDDQSPAGSLMKPLISSQQYCHGTTCLAAVTAAKQQHGEDDQFPYLSYNVSMAETMKNVDGNYRDFWYKLFMENSNEVMVCGNLRQFG